MVSDPLTLTLRFAAFAAVALLGGTRPQMAESRAADDASLLGVVAAREYHASWTERGLQSPNRTQKLRVYYARDGLRVLVCRNG